MIPNAEPPEELEDDSSSEPRPDIHKLLAGPVDVRSIALTGLFGLALLFTLAQTRDLLLPIILAVLLKFLLSPVMRLFDKIGISAPLGAGLLLVVAVTVVTWTVYAVRTPALEWFERLPASITEVERKVDELRKPVAGVKEVADSVERMTEGDEADGAEKPEEVELSEPTFQEQMMEGAQQFAATAAVMIGLLYFLLASGDLFLRKMVRVLPRLTDRKKAVEIARRIESDISRHLSTITAINAGLGVAIALALWGLGMPNPILWGVLAMTLNFVPYLGAMVGIAIVSIASFLTFDDPTKTILVAGCYLLLTSIEGTFVTPAILGRNLSLNPVAVFLGLFFWGSIWGVPGALLAVPIVASTKIICDRIESLQAIGEFLGS